MPRFEAHFNTIFQRNRKCIINADLDGVLSGMLLQEFLDWEIIGFSSCSGKPTDELWIPDGTDINTCVFVDLPVSKQNIDTVDQHFVLLSDADCENMLHNTHKLNPNVIRGRIFSHSDYTGKYPFGTCHFILACLEAGGMVPEEFKIDLTKQIDGEEFRVADLIFRADRVIGNTVRYTENCLGWARWLESIGGVWTKTLFDIVMHEYSVLTEEELAVGRTLQGLGCSRDDGDVTGFLRTGNIDGLSRYLKWLAQNLGIYLRIPNDLLAFGKLSGYRWAIRNINEY